MYNVLCIGLYTVDELVQCALYELCGALASSQAVYPRDGHYSQSLVRVQCTIAYTSAAGLHTTLFVTDNIRLTELSV